MTPVALDEKTTDRSMRFERPHSYGLRKAEIDHCCIFQLVPRKWPPFMFFVDLQSPLPVRPSHRHHRHVDAVHQQVHDHFGNFVRSRLLANLLENRLQCISHSLEGRTPDMGSVVLVLVRDCRLGRAGQVHGPSREGYDVAADVQFGLP